MRISSRSKAVSWSNRSFSAINRTRPNRLSIVQPWVASDRHTFFDARCACQKLIRLIGIGVPPWLRPELPVSAPDQTTENMTRFHLLKTGVFGRTNSDKACNTLVHSRRNLNEYRSASFMTKRSRTA